MNVRGDCTASTNGECPATTSGEATIRLKLPWHVILAALAALAAVLIVMWASVNRLTEQVGELRVAVQAGNTIMVALQNDVNLLKWRVETTERLVRERNNAR